ncbi:MAG: ATP-binding cassette domain-containing protein, partial [Candidatus Enterosoma sp.]|nr:ATP-binding cassette domain-containing protein [Candidatus Enterosoma sp.]
MIEIKHLKKTYISKDKSKSRGLVDVSFTLPSSGFVFVLGKSGSGKSTLLNRLGTLDEPTSGEILVDGKDISCFTDEERSYY